MGKRRRNHCRIVLTGGPGGRKTTAADLFRRELREEVVLVPEAATLLFAGGFPHSKEKEVKKAAQRAIYHVQYNLEDVRFAQHPGQILLCDRGTVDGAIYWPGEPHEFFDAVGTTLEKQFARYDAVIFFESAAVGGLSIESANMTRIETVKEAKELDEKLKKLWSQHPKFSFVPHHDSFFRKITLGLNIMRKIVENIS